MKFYQLQKIINQPKKSSGFTLAELLIGALVGTIVVSAAGWGLIQMLDVTLEDADETERRAEISRAMDFVSDEIRQAKKVWNNHPDTADIADSTTVFELQIPDVTGDGNDDFITYYIKEGTYFDSSKWRGPQVLYRRGPVLNADGEYTTSISTGDVLIDSLQKRPTPGCAGTVFPTPVSGEVPGFAVCLENPVITDVNTDGINETNSEIAHLYFSGVFSSDINSGTYWADSKTFARANEDINVAAIVPDKSVATTTTSGGGCSVQNNAVVCPQPTIVSIRSLESAYACDAAGTNWKMKTEVKIGTDDGTGNVTDASPDILDENNSSATVSLGTNDSIQVISDPYLGNSWSNPDTASENNCLNSSNIVDSNNTNQVKVLDVTSNTFFSRDGFNDGTNQQASVFEILNREGLVLTKEQILSGKNRRYQIEDDGSTITIKELQVDDEGNESYQETTDYKIANIDGIDYLLTSNDEYVLDVEKDQQLFLYLFEIGQSDPNQSGFDQQDNIVLITTESSSS